MVSPALWVLLFVCSLCIDGLNQLRAALDATRLRDGKRVMLKKVLPEEGPYELQISRMFSEAEVATNPRNHCVPLLDVITLPNSSQRLMVTPFLRPFDNPHFQTFGEFVAFFTQVCEVCSRFFFRIGDDRR